MARGSFDRGGLTEKEKKLYQRRLSHYLKDYRYRNDLKAADVAETFGYATPKYISLESELIPHGRFTNSLDFLAALGALTGMSLSQFITHLDPKYKPLKSDEDKSLLYSWENDILHTFNTIALSVRKEFADNCKKNALDGREKMQALIRIVNILFESDLKALEGLEDFLMASKSKKEKK